MHRQLAVSLCSLAVLSYPALNYSAQVYAASIIPTTHTRNYLLIGMGPVNDAGGLPGVGQAVNVNNFELGANNAPVPSTSSFLNSGGGPSLLGNVPDIPLQAKPVASGIGGGGNIAITAPTGVFNLQDVGVYGDLGIHTAGSLPNADAGTSNSFFNDPNHFPNTFTSTGFTNPGVNNNTGGSGLNVNPGAAVQSTRIDKPNSAGVTDSFNFAPLMNELFGPGGARDLISSAAPTGVLDVSSGIGDGGQGEIEDTTFVYTVGSGTHIIDINTGGGVDFKLNDANFVIDGPADAFVVFRLPNDANFLISNGNVLAGNNIGNHNILFYTDKQDNDSHFNFDNTVLNGVAFWSLGQSGGEIVINNAQGCTQLIADKINLNDVRFDRCEFIHVPEPSTLWLAGALLLACLNLRVRAGARGSM